MDDDLFEAFVAGFLQSGEGFNAEYPFEHLGYPFEPDDQPLHDRLRPIFEEWVALRD